MEVSVMQLKKATNQPSEVDRQARKILAEAIRAEKPLIKSITAGNKLDPAENLEKRRETISAKALEPVNFAYERAIGKNDSLYSNFAELVALTKRKVGRIVVIKGGEKESYATGFMVSPRLLLTNWHVFQNKEMADESEVHFFYEYDALGHPGSPVIFKFDATGFFNDKILDYCFVAVQPMDVTGTVPLERIGYLYLDKTLGKIGDIDVEKLNIIHHPLGDYKQISIRENTFKGIGNTTITYVTDTAPGSSGSPVFNDQWQVVGLHHKSCAKMRGEDYLDKDGNVIPAIDGKIDASRIVWEKNEGIRISVILNHVSRQHPASDLVAGLGAPPPREDLTFTINGSKGSPKTQKDLAVPDASGRNINIYVPVNALSVDRSIEISLSSKTIDTGHEARTATSSNEIADELLLEVAKIEKERKMDFSECKGYDSKFLGGEISLPQPKKTIEKQIARLQDGQIELKYFKHSVIFNAVTRMALISAVNVEGDATLRLDDSKRSDDWLRDTRIDIECQLTDKFYSKSNFDKGHMSRFEDADWGPTQEDALRSGIYTCFYTNACPQVADLNRAGGLWGKLEKEVLEKGIKKQQGKEARMSVFNGPIFSEGKDRIFKGVRIPMEFYKIILWLNDDGKLRATAFKLSQEALVDDVRFDESMRLAEEALDIDRDLVFKHYQCSIRSLGDLTNVDFQHLEQYDTFPANNDSEECFIHGVESIVL
jgi:endonuclease G, mitochondrial